MILDDYLGRITGEHRNKPNFRAVLTTVLTPIVNVADQLRTLPAVFDLDVATGVALDVLGEWVGISRRLVVTTAGMYFSLDTTGLGFDQARWLPALNQNPSPPAATTDGVFVLDDDHYRLLLRAKILNNKFDGSLGQAYAIADEALQGTPYQLFIINNSDLSFYIGLFAPAAPDAQTLALFKGGYLMLRPAGIELKGYAIATTSLFAFDNENTRLRGFDEGSWLIITKN